MKATGPMHHWEFRSRFRRHAFGWRSQATIQRISPALENVDSSSGAIGTAVNKALDALVPLIAEAVADVALREEWLDRLWAAIAADQIRYLDRLPDYWGDLCGSRELAAVWANRLIGITRLALSPAKRVRGREYLALG